MEPSDRKTSGLLELRDPDVIRQQWLPWLRPLVRRYWRAEVRGLENLPDGGALLVSNHSGGFYAMDFPVLLVAFEESFGAERPLHLLGHGILGALGSVLDPVGMLPANRDTAHQALLGGTTLLVFPGGDRDVARPTARANVIDFKGRTGYVRTALEAGRPIVPMVSVGGQETQYFLPGGEALANFLGLQKRFRIGSIPISLGFPFGLNVLLPLNLPLPAKLTSQILEPIDVRALFGPDPDLDEVDRLVRDRMQSAIDALAAERRFPVIG